MNEINLEPEILNFLAEYLKCPIHQLNLEKLKGDASEREYYRFRGKGSSSTIICFYHQGLNWKEMPQKQVYQIFLRNGVPVAEILKVKEDLGIIIFEDLGGKTLQSEVQNVDPIAKERLYQKAINILISIQTKAASALKPTMAAAQLVFNEGKLLWELNFFYQHFLFGLLKKAIAEEHEQKIKSWFREISIELADLPRTLCHRDYHSRNIMRKGGKLYLLDYQDARQGPYSYDLASLLRDSYIQLPEYFVEQMIEYYLTKHPKLKDMDPQEFMRQFDLMSLQRNLKAIGTFAYQAVKKENHYYLQYIPPTLSYIKANLSKYDKFHSIKDTLSQYIKQLA
jgi:aminoglycoside/choline kinase family phosphotransferase